MRLAPFTVLAALAGGLLAASPAAAQQGGGGGAPPPNVQEANQRVQQGERLFEQGDYDAALAEFEQAYQVIGDHPARFLILYNIGQAHERRFRYDLAMRYYRRYLEEGGPNAPDRAAVQASIGALEGLLATVHIDVNVPQAEVWIADRQVGEAPGDVLVTGGRHVLEVRADGYAPSQQEIQIAPRTEQTLEFTLSEYGQGLEPTYFWIATIAAGVALVAGGSVGLGAILRRADVDSQLEDPVDKWRVGQEEREEIGTLALAADILYGSAVLFGVTALILGLMTDFDGSSGDAEAPEEGASLRMLPFAGPTGGGLGAEVRW